MSTLDKALPLCTADVFRGFQYETRFLYNRRLLEDDLNDTVGSDVCHFTRSATARRRRAIVRVARTVHVTSERTRLTCRDADVGLVLRRRNDGAYLHVTVCRDPVSEDDAAVLEGRKNIRIRDSRQERYPGRFKRRARNCCGLGVDLGKARFVGRNLILRLLKLRRTRTILCNMLFRKY